MVDMVEAKKVEFIYCPSESVTTQIMTKPLNGKQFQIMRYDLGFE
jgi:hypothetical protein